VLDVEALVVHRGRRRVIGWAAADGTSVEGLTFTLFEGDVAVLRAPNGWGKSTLVEALQGTLPAESGRILLDGRALTRGAAWERARAGLASLPSRGHGFPCLTVAENLKLARDADASRVAGRDRRLAGVLSGGQRQNLALSCLPRSPRCLLMDEPFASLDESGISRALEFVAGVSPRGCVLVCVPAASAAAAVA
jgi:ABC-type branched-subunit amino acid transport system ATPase component